MAVIGISMLVLVAIKREQQDIAGKVVRRHGAPLAPKCASRQSRVQLSYHQHIAVISVFALARVPLGVFAFGE